MTALVAGVEQWFRWQQEYHIPCTIQEMYWSYIHKGGWVSSVCVCARVRAPVYACVCLCLYINTMKPSMA